MGKFLTIFGTPNTKEVFLAQFETILCPKNVQYLPTANGLKMAENRKKISKNGPKFD